MSRAVITGLGAVSGLGLGVPALWEGLCAGTVAVRRYAALDTVGLDIGPLAKVLLPADVEPGAGDDGRALLDGRPRATAMALWAADEALHDAGLGSRGGALRLGLSVGTTLGEKAPWVQLLRAHCNVSAALAGGAFGVSAPARALGQQHQAQTLRVISTACASGNAALGVALQWIRADLCDAVLCGGVDAISEFVLSGFHSLRAHAKEPCRPFDRDRSGLNLGEGAAFLIVEAEPHARARGQRVRAYLDGYGLSCDANHMTGPDRQGRGAARAMVAALQDAELAADAVDFVSAHGTATAFNDLMEARALVTVLGAGAATTPVNSIKGTLGHTLGAAGAIEAVMAVRALEEQLVPPTAGHRERDPEITLDVVSGAPRAARVLTVLSTSSGFGGVNAALVLRRGDAVDRKTREAAASAPQRDSSAFPLPLTSNGTAPSRNLSHELERGRAASFSSITESLPAATSLPCAVLAAGAIFPAAGESLSALLPAGAPPELAGQLLRTDRLCALAACAAERALSGVWTLRQSPPWPSERIGVIVGSSYGCHKTDEDYYRTVLAKQPSPRLFAYTLPSSPVGELSILHRLRGPGLTVVSGRSAGLEALAEAQTLLHRGQLDACLVIAVEVANPLFRAAPVAQSAEPGDAAVALLITRADSPLAGSPAACGYLLGTAAAYRAAAPELAFAAAAAAALTAADLPTNAVETVLGDEGMARDLPSLASTGAASLTVSTVLPERQGAAAALHALMVAAAGTTNSALILSGDSQGQVASAVWSRSRR